MKGRGSFWLLALLVVLSVQSVSAATLVGNINPTSVNTGDKIFVVVEIQSINNLYAYQFDVNYDPAIVRYAGVQKGNFLSQGCSGCDFFSPGSDTGTSVSNIVNTRLDGQMVSGTGTLVTLEFDAISAGTASFSFNNVKISDSTPNTLAVTVGTIPSVTIQGASGTTPGTVGDLDAVRLSDGSIQLAWTAPDDGSGGTVDSYEIRYSDSLATIQNWVNAPVINKGNCASVTPRTPGTLEVCTIASTDISVADFLAESHYALVPIEGSTAGSQSNVATAPLYTPPTQPPAPTTADISVLPRVSNVQIGNTVDVDLAISGASNLFAYQLELTYDSSLIELTGVSEGAFLKNGCTGCTFFSHTPHPASVTIVSTRTDTTEVSGNGILATLKFKGLKGGNVNLGLINVKISDQSGNVLSSNANGNTLTVIEKQLTIFDDTDTKTRLPMDDILFSAAYEWSNGNPITGANCKVSFDSGATWDAMVYDAFSGTYTFTASFSSAGSFNWQVDCDGMRATDTYTVTQPTTTCTDADGDGYGDNCAAGPDCDDSDPNVQTTRPCKYDGVACGSHNLCVAQCPVPPQEVCDTADNDCDGQIDEGLTNACGTCGPVPNEVCDGIDNNCDGTVDEGCGTQPPSTSQNHIYASPAMQSTNVGAQAVVDILVNNAANMFAYQFDLVYDEGLLDHVSTTEGAFLKQGCTGCTFFKPTPTSGKIAVAATRLDTTLVSGVGTLATITFTGQAQGTSNLDLQNVKVSDSSASVVSSSHTDGKIDVMGTAAGTCGDGVIQTDETCDGSNLGGLTCSDIQGFSGGTLSCNSCSLDTSACTVSPPSSGPACGNGLVETGEACDGSDLGGLTCADLGFSGGTLSCDTTCMIDTSACVSATPSCQTDADCAGQILCTQVIGQDTPMCDLSTNTCVCGPGTAGAVVSVMPSAQTVQPGDTFTINVDVSNVVDLFGYQFDVTYDPAVMTYVKTDEGTFLRAGCTGCTFFSGQQSTGRINVVNVRTSGSPVSGSGTLATLTFKAASDGMSALALSTVKLSDQTSTIIPNTNVDGSVAVGTGGVCTPTEEVCDGVDNDCDGIVDEGCDFDPPMCLIPTCAAPPDGCVYVQNDELDENGCPLYPCGDLRCETPECTPSKEVCDGVDNDCDGAVDEKCGGVGRGGVPPGHERNGKVFKRGSQCTTDWQCTDWTPCIEGFQSRSCSDANSCGTNDGKPEEMRLCAGTCDDGVMNGDEAGIDCGGSCLQACEDLSAGDLVITDSTITGSVEDDTAILELVIVNTDDPMLTANVAADIKDDLLVVVEQAGISHPISSIMPGEEITVRIELDPIKVADKDSVAVKIFERGTLASQSLVPVHVEIPEFQTILREEDGEIVSYVIINNQEDIQRNGLEVEYTVWDENGDMAFTETTEMLSVEENSVLVDRRVLSGVELRDVYSSDSMLYEKGAPAGMATSTGALGGGTAISSAGFAILAAVFLSSIGLFLFINFLYYRKL